MNNRLTVFKDYFGKVWALSCDVHDVNVDAGPDALPDPIPGTCTTDLAPLPFTVCRRHYGDGHLSRDLFAVRPVLKGARSIYRGGRAVGGVNARVLFGLEDEDAFRWLIDETARRYGTTQAPLPVEDNTTRGLNAHRYPAAWAVFKARYLKDDDGAPEYSNGPAWVNDWPVWVVPSETAIDTHHLIVEGGDGEHAHIGLRPDLLRVGPQYDLWAWLATQGGRTLMPDIAKVCVY